MPRIWDCAFKILSESQQKVIKLFNDYSKVASKVKYRSICWKGLKIWTPTQMIQRLPIAFAQVKTVNIPENLLSEIRQIIYSLYQAQEITKKVYNNIIHSINL